MESVLYEKSQDGLVVFLTLNQPDHYNAIDSNMPKAQNCSQGFCGGYDLGIYAEKAQRGQTDGMQDLRNGYDPLVDYMSMGDNTACFMELFHSAVPTIAQVHGAAVAGGSDIALSRDLVVMADNARIGYPPSRVWGSPTTAIWAIRLGSEKAKRMLFTGDLISGKEAESMGLILNSVPETQLEETVQLLADRIKNVPRIQNWMHKQVINGFVEESLINGQRLSTIFDGITRNSPEGIAFQKLTKSEGFKEAIAQRDAPGRTERYRKVWKSML